MDRRIASSRLLLASCAAADDFLQRYDQNIIGTRAARFLQSAYEVECPTLRMRPCQRRAALARQDVRVAKPAPQLDLSQIRRPHYIKRYQLCPLLGKYAAPYDAVNSQYG